MDISTSLWRIVSATPDLRLSSHRFLSAERRRLSWPDWLVTYPRTLTHLNINRNHVEETSLMRATDYLTRPQSYSSNTGDPEWPSGLHFFAKYCKEYVCVSVCLSVCSRGYLRKDTRDLYQICVRMLLMAVARSSSGKVTTSQENGHFGGFSSTLTMHYTA